MGWTKEAAGTPLLRPSGHEGEPDLRPTDDAEDANEKLLVDTQQFAWGQGDLNSNAHKHALITHFETHRADCYGHLSQQRFEK